MGNSQFLIPILTCRHSFQRTKVRDEPLITYLIVNICLDLGESAVIDQQSVLRPNAMIILAFHWPCEGTGCANDGIGNQH